VVAASQPCFFPWLGMLELIRAADVYVHVTHVQFTRGFSNRVQVKHAAGSHWLTVPVKSGGRAQLIRDVEIDESTDWRDRQLSTLRTFYAHAPHRDEMLSLAEAVLSRPTSGLAELTIASMHALLRYFGLDTGLQILDSSQLSIQGRASDMVLSLVRAVHGERYVTAHGARDYLDHERFEREGVAVEYIDYERRPYPQLHGAFDAHVSALDLVANLGQAGVSWIRSPTVPWRTFLERPR
jgi:hypothetical protein